MVVCGLVCGGGPRANWGRWSAEWDVYKGQALGLCHPFLGDKDGRMVGVEAAGHGLHTGQHAASLCAGRPGVLHGCRTYLMDDDAGQIQHTHSISAGLDYPGVGPEHAWLKDTGRAEYVGITDDEALEAFHQLTRLEGIPVSHTHLTLPTINPL